MSSRYAKRLAKVDENQSGIVRDLRRVGARVLILARVGDGCADLLVWFRGRFFLLEVKNPNTRYGLEGATEEQRTFARLWSDVAPFSVVYTSAEAFAAIGLTVRAA